MPLKKRRDFLKASAKAIALAAPFSMASPADASTDLPRVKSESKVRLGFIGLKGMGWGNLQAFQKNKESEVVAFCDVDANVLRDRTQEFQAQFGFSPAGYADYRAMLEKGGLDAVVINTPDHWHALQMVHSLEKGLHIYVEKPLANSVEECLYLEKAANRYGKVVQVGQQQRSARHFSQAIEWLAQGHLGKIRLVRCWIFNAGKGSVPKVSDEPVPAGVDYEAWLGPAPSRPFNRNRFHFTFRWYWEYAGGLMTDWGVHLLDIGLWGMGSPWPTRISAGGGKYAFPSDDMQTPDTLQVNYQFPDFLMTWEHTLGIGMGPFGREHGVAFYGENGTLIVDRKGWEVQSETIRTGGQVKEYRIKPVPFQPMAEGDRVEHTGNFLRAILKGEKLACPIQTGVQAAVVAHLGNVAYRSGKTIEWDPVKKRVTGPESALEFTQNPYRKPFTLPKI